MMKKESTFAIYIVNKVISFLTHKEFLKPEEKKKSVKPKIMVKERNKYFMHACMFCHSVISNSLQLMDCSPPDSSVLSIFPSKNTGVGCHFLLQRILPTQESNLCLLHWQRDSFFTTETAEKSLNSL